MGPVRSPRGSARPARRYPILLGLSPSSPPDVSLLPPETPASGLRYKRSRFATRIPTERRYTAGHLWLLEAEPGLWRVGFTKFALRMLGDPVELDFEVEPDAPVERGQVIGWVEGFKAVSDVFAPMDGTFAGENPALVDDVDLLHRRPYDEGWLFALRGVPGEDCVDAQGYAGHLDATIDRMLERGS